MAPDSPFCPSCKAKMVAGRRRNTDVWECKKHPVETRLMSAEKASHHTEQKKQLEEVKIMLDLL